MDFFYSFNAYDSAMSRYSADAEAMLSDVSVNESPNDVVHSMRCFNDKPENRRSIGSVKTLTNRREIRRSSTVGVIAMPATTCGDANTLRARRHSITRRPSQLKVRVSTPTLQSCHVTTVTSVERPGTPYPTSEHAQSEPRFFTFDKISQKTLFAS